MPQLSVFGLTDKFCKNVMEEQVNTKTYLKNTMLMCCIYVSTNDSDVRYEYGMHPFCAPNISIKQDSLLI